MATRTRKFTTPLWAACMGVAWCFAAAPTITNAETVSTTTNCGGNPTGQTCYVVSGLETGDVIDLTWSLPADAAGTGSPPVDLTATGSITVSAIATDSIGLSVAIANTTDPGTYTGRLSLTSLGFTTGDDKPLTGGTVTNNTTGATWDFSTNTFPAFATDGCFFSGTNCAGGGGASNSLNPGESDSFTATIFGTFGSTITLDTFATKWQTDAGSYEVAGVVPIPAAAWLFGSALLGMAGIGYRRSKEA